MSSSGPPFDAEDSVNSSVFDESGNVEPGVLDKDFFEVLVENGSDAIVSIDEQSRILFANRSVERVFGYEPDELVGEPLTTIMPERFRDAHHAAIEAYLRTGERTLDWQNVELPAQHKDGHEVQLSITFEEHRYEGQRVFSGIMRDVTERVERENELQRQNEQLERFASIVSHDLRDPLQTAKADVAILDSQYENEPLLDELDDTLDRMDELIEDVLTLAKQGKSIGDTARVPLERVVEDAWATAGTDEATLDIEGNLLAVKADRERFETLLQNLFRNAVEHVGDDVTVRVGLLSGGFYVEDDGPGFPEDAMDDLFEYGFTTSDAGTGFGLSIVEQIADAHGWSVEAMNGEDGARFEFRDVVMS